MIVGFTGTRRGMTKEQRMVVRGFLMGMDRIEEAHHGLCVGADAEFHAEVKMQGRALAMVGHLPIDGSLMMPHDAWEFTVLCEPLPYLERNRRIVDDCDVLLATPGEGQEVVRGSGTWATIRYAAKIGRPVWVVLPSGIAVRGRPQ